MPSAQELMGPPEAQHDSHLPPLIHLLSNKVLWHEDVCHRESICRSPNEIPKVTERPCTGRLLGNTHAKSALQSTSPLLPWIRGFLFLLPAVTLHLAGGRPVGSSEHGGRCLSGGSGHRGFVGASFLPGRLVPRCSQGQAGTFSATATRLPTRVSMLSSPLRVGTGSPLSELPGI